MLLARHALLVPPNYATLAGTETLTNKTFTSPTINTGTLSNTSLTGTLTANSSAGTNGQYLQTTGTGVRWNTLPTATTSVLGLMSVGTGLQVTAGAVSVDSSIVKVNDLQSLTNKVVDLGSNVVYGTTAQFNQALSDNNFVTQEGSEIVSNKILTSSVITSPLISGGVITDPTAAFTYDKVTGYTHQSDTIVTPATSQSLFHSPMASQTWHDVFAFGRTFGYPVCEVSATSNTLNGALSTVTLDKRLFAQKDNQDNLTIDGTTVKLVRFTWSSVMLTGNLPMWLQIDYGSSTGTPATKNVKVIRSPDNFNYYSRHDSTYSHSDQSVFHYINPLYSMSKLQVQIEWISGGPINISGIRLLVAKTNSQDGSKTYEYPYDWDGLGRMTVKDSLTIVNPLHNYFNGPSVKLLASENIINSYTLTIPESSGTTDRLISRTSTDTLSNKTLTAPIINNGLTLRGSLTASDIFGNPSTGSLGQVLISTVTGVEWGTPNSARTPFSLQIGIGLVGEGSSFDGSSQVSIGINQTYLANYISGIETTLRNKTLEYPKVTGRIKAGDTWGDPGQVLTSTGTGVKWASAVANFDFGNFTGTFTDPISYLLDKAGMDFGTFTQPTNLSVDLGTI